MIYKYREVHIIFWFNLAAGAKFKVAVIGGGPSGSCAAEALAKNPVREQSFFPKSIY